MEGESTHNMTGHVLRQPGNFCECGLQRDKILQDLPKSFEERPTGPHTAGGTANSRRLADLLHSSSHCPNAISGTVSWAGDPFVVHALQTGPRKIISQNRPAILDLMHACTLASTQSIGKSLICCCFAF